MAKLARPRLRRILSLTAAAVLGCAIGAAIFGVGYSEATAYLGSDPATCANCHVMNDQYEGWMKGSHAAVATCNDCHLPHDDIIGKYLVKAEDGFLHGAKFTLNNYPENIRIRDSSLRVANEACLSCHADLTNDMRYAVEAAGDTISCVRCHEGVGHE